MTRCLSSLIRAPSEPSAKPEFTQSQTKIQMCVHSLQLLLCSTRCHCCCRRSRSEPLTDQDHESRPLVRPLLIAGHLLIGQEVGVPQVGAVSRGSLSVLPTQTETPSKASCGEVWRDGTAGSTQTRSSNICSSYCCTKWTRGQSEETFIAQQKMH